MREKLLSMLDLVDRAVAHGTGVLPAEELEDVGRLAARIRARLWYPDDVVIVALAGGTGSGKSSLANALAGEDLADTGGIRPTTSETLAILADDIADLLDSYLDQLGITRRVVARQLTGLCLLDLPDTDSVEVDHRLAVARLLPWVDLIVWVSDPEKYGDAALHNEFVAPLAAYGDQMVFVLNQVDRVDEVSRQALVHHFGELLGRDGLERPLVVPMAADPGSGPPMGVDALGEYLQAVASARPALAKLWVDLVGATDLLAASASAGPGFRDRWKAAMEEALDQGMSGEPAAAGHVLAEFVASLADELPTDAGNVLRRQSVEIPALVGGIFAGHGPSSRSGFAELLESEIAEPARTLMERKATAVATINEMRLKMVTILPPAP